MKERSVLCKRIWKKELKGGAHFKADIIWGIVKTAIRVTVRKNTPEKTKKRKKSEWRKSVDVKTKERKSIVEE